MSHAIIKGQIVGTTAAAILLKTSPGTKPKWIPRSVVKNGEDVKYADRDPEVADWFIEKADL